MLKILACGEGDVFVPAAADQLPGLLGAKGALFWVDLEQPTEEEARILAGVFHFHPLTIEDSLNDHLDPPKVDDYGDYLFLQVQANEFVAGAEAVTAVELNIYLGPSYVVTVHDRPLAAISEVEGRCQRGTPATARGADWLLHEMLDGLVDDLLPVATTIDERISALEDEALARPEPDLVRRMTMLKRSVLRLHRNIGPQRDVVNRLSRGDYPLLIRPATNIYYRDIYDHLVRLEELVQGLRDLGDSVISTYLASVNNRMNSVMKTLSIVGSIFLPLTLLASIFGTNFGPTYFSWGWPGFAGMCIFMLLSIGGSLWLFGRAGWLS